MRRGRRVASRSAARPLATATPVLLALLAVPWIERSRGTVASPVPAGPRGRDVVLVTSPLEADATAGEVFDWLRVVERIPFERPVELRLDVIPKPTGSPRLRAAVVAVADVEPVEEKR